MPGSFKICAKLVHVSIAGRANYTEKLPKYFIICYGFPQNKMR